jgi:galactonate dehydratase
VQVDACTPNVAIQEQSLGIHYNQGADLLDYLIDPKVFQFCNGYIQIPKGPGLGIEVNKAKVIAASGIGHAWKNPVWRNYDGTIAEW